MKSKLRKQREDIIYIAILLLIPVCYYFLMTFGDQLFASSVDWSTQHSVFPDYFRKLFYKTGQLFPQYSAEIGGGQNINNFAYYGLYNPVILLSYLLPFVKMSTYLQAVGLVTWMATGVLCYLWLKKRYQKHIAFFATLLLILSGPMVIHTSSQMMFVSYMPFLLIALIGADRYQEKNKYGLIVFGLTCTLLSSFYYGVGAYLAVFLYIVCGWKKSEFSNLKEVIVRMWHTFYPFILAGTLAFFYLVPIVMVLGGGRSEAKVYSLRELLVPNITINRFLYGGYGLGLTAIGVIAIVTILFYKNSQEKKLALFVILFSCFPILLYAMNCGLYIRGKVLIPFLPLIAMILAKYFTIVIEKDISKARMLIGFGISMGILVIMKIRYSRIAADKIYIDAAICILFFAICILMDRRAILVGGTISLLALSIICAISAREELMLGSELTLCENANLTKAMESIIDETEITYRSEIRGDYDLEKRNMNRVLTLGENLSTCYSSICNNEYSTFRKYIGLNYPARNNLMQNATMNPVFTRFMGIKNVVSTKEKINGYEKQNTVGDASVFTNETVAPIFYLTDKAISNESFDAMTWQERQAALLKTAVTKDGSQSVTTDFDKYYIDLNDNAQSVGLKVTDDKIEVDSQIGIPKNFKLDHMYQKGDLIFVSCKVKNLMERMDMSISVNGVRNKLTMITGQYYNGNTEFKFTVRMPKKGNHIKFVFSSGKYELSDLQIEGTADIDSSVLYQETGNAKLNKNRDTYTFQCDTDKDRYLITSIPYDKNFILTVDGKETEIEKVNTAFVGAKIAKGTHQIQLTYDAPGRNLGLLLSGITIVILVFDWIRRNKFKKEDKVSVEA